MEKNVKHFMFIAVTNQSSSQEYDGMSDSRERMINSCKNDEQSKVKAFEVEIQRFKAELISAREEVKRLKTSA